MTNLIGLSGSLRKGIPLYDGDVEAVRRSRR
jgi:hypothetical protein